MSDQPTVFFEDIEVGTEYWGTEEVADVAEMVAYAERFDPWPMHTDADAGAATPYGGLIGSGGYTIGLWYRSGHGIWNQPNRAWAFLGGFDWHVQFVKPLRPQDRVRLRVVFTDKRPSAKPGRGIAQADTHLVDTDNEPVLSIKVAGLFATRPQRPNAAR